MKVLLKYYYSLDVENIIKRGNEYIFSVSNTSYVFCQTDKTYDELNQISRIIQELHLLGIRCHEFIANKVNSIITTVDGKNYVLMKNNVNDDSLITINEIMMFSKLTSNSWNFDLLNRSDWVDLWNKKINNLYYAFYQKKKRYAGYMNAFFYYIGLSENAVQLLNECYDKDYLIFSVCHKRISFEMSMNEFYNPLNFIIDIASRDISEYIKSKMVYGIDVVSEVQFILQNKLYSIYEKKMMIIRFLFPNIYLDRYYQILLSNQENDNIYFTFIHNNYEEQIKKIYKLSGLYIPNFFSYMMWLNL